MSSSDADKLPAEFLLHTRSSRKAPWSHYVLVRRTTGPDGKNKLVLSPFSTILVPATEPAPFKAYAAHYDTVDLPFVVPFVSHDNAKIILVHFVRCNTATVRIHGDPPRTVPILFTNSYKDLLGPRLKPNFTAVEPPPGSAPLTTITQAQFYATMPDIVAATKAAVDAAMAAYASPIAPTPAPLTIPSPTAQGPAALTSLLDTVATTIAHVNTAPTQKVKKVVKKTVAAAPPSVPKGDLTPFVAKQLLALAKLRHEECPVVAEEFSDGNTAVMPCGHLFAQIAIEESFKKEPNRCPACRAPGRPTFV